MTAPALDLNVRQHELARRREDALLAFIKQWWREKHYSPSIRDMQAALDTPSTSTVRYRLLWLERRSLLTIYRPAHGQAVAYVPAGVCCCCGRAT